MSSPIRDAQLQADRAARVNYQQALQQALEEEKLADPAYQARIEQAKIDKQKREAYQEQRSQDFQDNWNARFREVFPNAPIPGSAEAAAFNPITISRDAGVMKPLAEVRNQAYQDTGTLPPNTQLLMPNGTIRPITSVYPEYMDKQMEKVGEDGLSIGSSLNININSRIALSAPVINKCINIITIVRCKFITVYIHRLEIQGFSN